MLDSEQQEITRYGLEGVGSHYGRQLEPWNQSRKPELLGKRYGSVQIVSDQIEYLGSVGNRHLHVRTECVTCGYRSIVALNPLQTGLSAGCRACNQPPPTYPQWLWGRCAAMKQRCTNPKDPGWQNYGARGIEFQWERPKDACLWIMEHLGIPENHSTLDLDRIDNDGHYAPGNLRWVSRHQNAANRRRSRLPRMHAFKFAHPDIRYADATLSKFIGEGLTNEEIVARWHTPSFKPKGKYGTYETPDPAIASLVRGS